jgi:uncharacterized membrane protein YfcA
VFALAVFVYNGQVVWAVGLILAVGNMLGARVAARMVVSAAALVGLPQLIGQLF